MRLLDLPWLDTTACTLSPKEAQVAKLLAEGKKIGAIAEELGIAVSTVQTHCQHIQKKWNVENQPQLYQEAGRLEHVMAAQGFQFGLEDTVYLPGSPRGYLVVGQQYTRLRAPDGDERQYRLQGPQGPAFWIQEQHLRSAPSET